MSTAVLSLGALDLVITADYEIVLPADPSYCEFLNPRRTAPSVVHARFVVTEAPIRAGRVVFESEAPWRILAEGSRRVILDETPAGFRSAVHIEPGSPHVLVECSPALLTKDGRLWCPLRYPVDQILAMYLLAERALLIHAAGLVCRDQAVVLSGVSGAGKSTFARLAVERRPAWKPLSDDRIIARVPEGGSSAVAHGTPWAGQGRAAANDSAPMAHLLFLCQGGTNSVGPLSAREAAHRLLRTASVPWFDAEYAPAGLSSCERILQHVPAALLTFRPDAGAVDCVERLLSSDVRAS